ncbi:hypothetical protein D3C78_1862010 [compost metagenome]
MEMARAEAGHLGQFDHRDAPRQVLADIAVQPLDIQRTGRCRGLLAEQAQVQGA